MDSFDHLRRASSPTLTPLRTQGGVRTPGETPSYTRPIREHQVGLSQPQVGDNRAQLTGGPSHGLNPISGKTSNASNASLERSFDLHRNYKSMGAAPGINSAEPLAPEFPEDYRRGRIQMEPPKHAAEWTTMKWAKHVELDPFKPKDEWEMENWYAKNATKIHAAQIPINKLLGTMIMAAQGAEQELLGTLWTKLSQCVYLEDLADLTAKALFKGNYIVDAIERKLMAAPTRGPAREAMLNLNRRLTNYYYMCDRRARTPAVHEEQKCTIFLASLQPEIEELIRLHIRSQTPEYSTICHLATEYEAIKGLTLVLTPNPSVWPAISTTVRTPTTPCSGCASLNHFKKECPYKKHRCVKCQKIGHISTACKNTLFKDRAGQTRLLVQPKKTGLTAANLLDQSRPAQTKTMYGTIGGTLQEQDTQRAKARQRRSDHVHLVPLSGASRTPPRVRV